MATNTGFSLTQAMVLAKPPLQGFAQALVDITRPAQTFGQVQTAVVKFAKQNAFGQAQTTIV